MHIAARTSSRRGSVAVTQTARAAAAGSEDRARAGAGCGAGSTALAAPAAAGAPGDVAAAALLLRKAAQHEGVGHSAMMGGELRVQRHAAAAAHASSLTSAQSPAPLAPLAMPRLGLGLLTCGWE